MSGDVNHTIEIISWIVQCDVLVTGIKSRVTGNCNHATTGDRTAGTAIDVGVDDQCAADVDRAGYFYIARRSHDQIACGGNSSQRHRVGVIEDDVISGGVHRSTEVVACRVQNDRFTRQIRGA